MQYNGGYKQIKYLNGTEIPFETFKFPGGEVHIKIKNEIKNIPILIKSSIQSSDDLIWTILAVDALKNLNAKQIHLYIPYVPYARQDRIMVKGEPFSIRVFANIINSLNLEKVIFYDAHSDVTSALINNSVNISNRGQVDQFILKYLPRELTIISPDAGSYKKIHQVCKVISEYHPSFFKEIIIANKVRNVKTGDITGCEIFGDVKDKDCLIIDDICDGGRTFIELGKILKEKEAKSSSLFVSHGIFSKGLDELKKYYYWIGTTDSFKDERDDRVQYFSIKELI